MRVVKISLFIFCTAILFAPQAAQSQEMQPQSGAMMQQEMYPTMQPAAPSMADNQMYAVPRTYTSPSGITKHYSPEMQTMHRQQMMMKHGQMNQDMMVKHDQMMMKKGMMHQDGRMMHHPAPYNNTMQPVQMGRCPMCAKIQAANLTPEMRANLMKTLTEFSAQNKPMFDELMMLKHQHMMLERSAMTSPAQKATIELKREKARKALMENLKRQQIVLKDSYGLDITGRDMLLHRLHQMKMSDPNYMPMSAHPPVYMNMVNGQPVYRGQTPMRHQMAPGHMHQKNLPERYRSPQKENPDYNQDYMMNAPMREGYTGQTYE
ncbi:hypothetical protein [Halodesulfovibrio sp.]|uniref:hypothetical protein n=1 Tax=Halodesulfovibrio sp. TaxID=1912772 RepID=UPI0025B90A11|nr:hypothetical protein [Halodesulfovibrio sp.]